MILQRFLEGKNRIKNKLTSFVFLFFFFTSIKVNAQKQIPFVLKFHLSPITIDSVHIETFKFYVSDLQLRLNNDIVFENKNLFKLVDLSEDSIFVLSTFAPSHLQFNSITFSLGVDSTTNKGGIHSGDLDPTKGMYWTWQSGYINLKLEGNSPKCPTRLNKFQFHIGGFSEGQYPLQILSYPASSNYSSNITIDLNNFLNKINFTKENSVMIPGRQAMELSKKMKYAFGNK